MEIRDLQNKFSEASEYFSYHAQTYLASSPCDEDTKAALDEIAHLAFDAIAATQNALIEYLEDK